jgi:hypothetical protein
MNEQWNNRDLELVVEKKQKGEPGVTKDEWSHHIVKLKEGEEIKWSIRHGFYHPPYEGEYVYRFTLLEASDILRLKVERETAQEIILGDGDSWSSGWYEGGDASYQVTLKVKESVYAICELPPGIRTMQQTDHDAWEYAVRNGLI